VLANDGIVLLDLHLLWHRALVLGRCIEVTSIGTGYEANFFADCLCHFLTLLNFFAARAHINKNGVNAFLIDHSHTLGRYTQLDPAVFTLDPELVSVKIG